MARLAPVMASFGDRGPAARKDLRVLLRFSCGTLRIPDELAWEIGFGEARVVFPSGGKVKVRRIEVARDGDGAFLRRGWPEFAAACGVAQGWPLVLRHHGGGVLTVKLFDASCCLTEFGSPPAASTCYVLAVYPKENLNNRVAVIFGPLGKFCQVELETNWSGVFFAGGWSQFLAFHSITEVNALLLRYEGNMVFTVKVFEPNGCQRGSEHSYITMLQNIEEQLEAPSTSDLKRCKIRLPSIKGQKIPGGSVSSLNKTSLLRNSVYEIGPPSWIQKQMNESTLKKGLALAKAFCDAIGLCKPCTITLKTSITSTKFWLVCGHPNKEKSYLLMQGWRQFCQDNSLKQGDLWTFNIIETTLWHVVIMRC